MSIADVANFHAYLDQIGVGHNDRVASSPKSYVSYLNSVSRILGLEITPATVSSRTMADHLAQKIRLLEIRSPRTVDHYKTALRRYAEFANLRGF